MHPSLLSVGDIKVPLPCSPLLWQAATSREWDEEMKRNRSPNRKRSDYSLHASLELLIPAHGGQYRPGRQSALEDLSSNPFTLQILIHAIASAVHHQNRSNTPFTPPHRSERYTDTLTGWLSAFDKMSPLDRTTEMARSALVTYHFVAIMLHENLSSIMMAAGSAYACGHVVTSQRAQEAFVLLTSTKPVGRDAYRHALEIVGLCLVQKTEISSPLSPQQIQVQPPSPLYVSYTAFLGVVVLWAYMIGRSQAPASSKPQHFISRMMNTGTLLLREPEARQDSASGDSSNNKAEDEQSLKEILDREFSTSETDSRELIATRWVVCRLMHLVRDRLTIAHWDICTAPLMRFAD
jgi:hypothetical protein